MDIEARLAAAEAQIATLSHELGRVQDLIAITSCTTAMAI